MARNESRPVTRRVVGDRRPLGGEVHVARRPRGAPPGPTRCATRRTRRSSRPPAGRTARGSRRSWVSVVMRGTDTPPRYHRARATRQGHGSRRWRSAATACRRTTTASGSRRIEGQVRGLQRMIDDDEYCIDVLTQIAAVTKALQGVGLGLLDEHLRHCVREAAAIDVAEGDEGRRGGPGGRTAAAGLSADLGRGDAGPTTFTAPVPDSTDAAREVALERPLLRGRHVGVVHRVCGLRDRVSARRPGLQRRRRRLQAVPAGRRVRPRQLQPRPEGLHVVHPGLPPLPRLGTRDRRVHVRPCPHRGGALRCLQGHRARPRDRPGARRGGPGRRPRVGPADLRARARHDRRRARELPRGRRHHVEGHPRRRPHPRRRHRVGGEPLHLLREHDGLPGRDRERRRTHRARWA